MIIGQNGLDASCPESGVLQRFERRPTHEFGGEEFEQQIQEQLSYKLDIVRRNQEQRGFVLFLKGWLIEQILGCQGCNHHLRRDYEQ